MRRRLTALALAGLFILGLAGCGDPQKELVGRWQYEADLTASISELVSANADADLAPYFTVERFQVPVVLAFAEDGSYRCWLDPAPLGEALDELRETVKGGAIRFAEDFIADEGLAAVGASAEDVLLAMGIDLDAALETAFGRLDVERLLGELVGGGQYAVKDGRLLLSPGGADEPTADRGFKLGLDGGTLTLEAPEGLELGVLTPQFPLVWDRIAE